jgi:hypothetical protein
LLTVVDPPLSPPPLSTPAGAERGANSRMWPCLFREDVHGLGQHHVYGWGGLGETCLEGRMCSDLRHFWDGAGGYSNWDHNSGSTPPRTPWHSYTGSFATVPTLSSPMKCHKPRRSRTGSRPSKAQAPQPTTARIRPTPPTSPNGGYVLTQNTRPHMAVRLPFPPRRGWKGVGG